MSPLDEHTLLSLAIAVMVLSGFSLVISVFRAFNLYIKNRTLEALQVIGGLIMLLGIGGLLDIRATKGALSPSIITLSSLFALIGGLLVVLPFFVGIKQTKIDRELKVQVFAILGSSVIYSFLPLPTLRKIGVILLLFGITLPIFILMKSISSLAVCSRFNKNLLKIASWLLVLHAWLRYYSFKNPQTCIHYGVLLIYFISLLIWVYSTLKTYETLREWL
ncbi:hypothetical protein DRN51_07310 [Thermococci archaeon]|nr:MAG: hypothetical protein DRN51_07310 [Thermococci archaeon]